MELNALDLFSGVGGLTEGMHQASFKTAIAFEINDMASYAYQLNHKDTEVISKDIRKVAYSEIKEKLKGKEVHLLAGCPPCQGFSSIRRLNRKDAVKDERNGLIMEYIRLVRVIKPLTIMMENVPGLVEYDLFKEAVDILQKELGYFVDFKVVNVKDYGVPQSRKRLVLVGSLLGEIKVAKPTNETNFVRDAIGHLPFPEHCADTLHKIFPNHTPKVLKRIKLTPKNGGSRKDLPDEYTLECHKGKNIGFNDVYGRLCWDNYSTTITGGCLNPSKGRFLHPEQNRNISAREAALLQSFPLEYIFPTNIPKSNLALMIGNALPPKFSYHQSLNIKKHLEKYLE
ncbi:MULTISPECIES: DNA cytosine methyltransferase [unclassified Arenibacter]|uniref:DNA cytosine methyltransferase n=1 Tax=unclassified Arenibacter TaxID=2615047 RepID=UPI000E346726|nr:MULTISPECIES: DNA cytosine methyltransferase [unclassified Arenibacter]MCM4162454.1 DNA (cytosine-5-)-methyltransferase [Arenibacter sp. A80]RFT58046.1 DNA cytosine methyltransferase [Arenibacter sp. P308M17]